MSGRAAGAAPGTIFRQAAPAKLNLYLHITGRRADGYHLVDSLIAFAAIHDTIEARDADALTLVIEGPFAGVLGREPDNLVLRAARALAELAGVRSGAAITLVKRLPVASGIGGGSADAAATLRALQRLWGVNLSEPQRTELALSLGADVPMCLGGQAAFAGGVGADLVPVRSLPSAGLVLVNPLLALSTAAVFKARTGPFGTAARFGDAPRDVASLARILAERRNALEPAATMLCPAISQVLAALDQAPGCRFARMSGSGATCFGLFDDEIAARSAAQALAAARPDWWVAPSRLVADTADLPAD